MGNKFFKSKTKYAHYITHDKTAIHFESDSDIKKVIETEKDYCCCVPYKTKHDYLYLELCKEEK